MYKPGSSHSISDSPRLQGVLQRVADDVVNHLKCVAAVITTITPDQMIEVQAYAQTDPGMPPPFIRSRAPKGFSTLTVRDAAGNTDSVSLLLQ